MTAAVNLSDTQDHYDVVVVGAGGAGMSAALFAAIAGARVLLVESTEYVGGTTAWSAGTSWIPNTHIGQKVRAEDSPQRAREFLDNAVGTRSAAVLRDAFLQNGPKAVAHIEAHSEVKYRARAYHPDYMSELSGAALRGRAIEPMPFDGRKLGAAIGLIRPPIPEFTVLGGMMVDRDDIGHLLKITQSWASFQYCLKILARHAVDRLRHPRGTRLVMGNALVGRLLYSLLQRKVTIVTRTRITALAQHHGAIQSVTLEQQGATKIIAAHAGVILASGGFNRHPAKRAQLLPGAGMQWCVGAPGHVGSAMDLALSAGAVMGHKTQDDNTSHAFWAPVSLRQRADGSTAVFPHFMMDRGKPGFVTVNHNGERFVNEATSYHLFGLALQKAHAVSPTIPAYLITDAKGLQRYGMGMVRPGAQAGTKAVNAWVADGYLTQAASVDELAAKLNVPAAHLHKSILHINQAALTGVDLQFNRGSTDYQRANGDMSRTDLANVCLDTIDTPPYFAVKLYPGDIGASTGLQTDAHARLLNAQGEPIEGLYACGNDMHSIMGGAYPAPGITLGPGLVFAYLAAQHACGRVTYAR